MKRRIGIIGGTGSLATGLALRWARHGHQITLGSRDRAKAIERARELSGELGSAVIQGGSNDEVAENCETACITVPFAAHDPTLSQLRGLLEGKIVVETTVPLKPPKVSTVQLPAGGSLAAHTQERLGPHTRVVAALHNVAADVLKDMAAAIDCDVMVFGNDEAARSEVVELIRHLGLRGFHAGPIGNSVAAEAMTSVLIGMNRRFRVHGAGLRFTGIPVE